MRFSRLVPAALVVMLVLAAVSASAQAPAPAAPGAPAAPPQIPYGAPITLEQAKKVVAGAEAEAKKNNWNAVFVVLDTGGHMVLLERTDGTQLGSIEAAREKAYSAVLYRRPTKVFEDGIAQGGINLRALRLPGASPLEGGLPIIVGGKVIGAFGVSGMLSSQDGQMARAGLDALK